jgi:Na+/phosphate symporter
MSEQTIKDLKKEIYLLMHKAQEMLELAEEGFMKNKLTSLDHANELAREIHAKEDALTAALAKMASTNSEARKLLSVPVLIENIANSIKRIDEGTRVRIKEGMLFSDKAINDTGKLFAKTKDVLKKSAEVAVTGAKAAAESVCAESDSVERMSEDFATAHEDRLVTGECSPRSSSTYLNMLYAFEEMGSHIKDAVTKLTC